MHLKTYTQNANGENYEKKWYDQTKELVGEYIDHHPTPTCLRNHAFYSRNDGRWWANSYGYN